MVHVILGGDELAGFVSAAHDNTSSVFPLPGEDKPALPPLGPNGRASPRARRGRRCATNAAPL